MRRFAILFITLLPAALPGQEVRSDAGWYMGGGVAFTSVGGSRLKQFDSSEDRVGDDLGYGITGGYGLNRNLAVEASYFYGAEPRFGTDELPPCLEPEFCDVDGKLQTRIATVSVLAIYPLDPFEFFVKGGAAFWDASGVMTLTSVSQGTSFDRRVDRSGTDFVFGVGVGVTIGERSHFRFTGQFFGVDRELLAIDRPVSINQFLLEYHWRF